MITIRPDQSSFFDEVSTDSHSFRKHWGVRLVVSLENDVLPRCRRSLVFTTSWLNPRLKEFQIVTVRSVRLSRLQVHGVSSLQFSLYDRRFVSLFDSLSTQTDTYVFELVRISQGSLCIDVPSWCLMTVHQLKLNRAFTEVFLKYYYMLTLTCDDTPVFQRKVARFEVLIHFWRFRKPV